jgi:hypothetical protein
MLRLRPFPLLFFAAALFLVPWSGWLVSSLPCRYLARHWGLAWAGFDAGLALALGLTALASVRQAHWFDRAAVATATLLAADAWFDITTSQGAAAIAVATTEALAIELPLALFCLWAAQAVPISPPHRRTTARTHKQGALS